MDWLVRASLPAFVRCGVRFWNTRARTGAGVDVVFATAVADRLFFHCDSLANRNHSDRELHFLELLGPSAGFPAVGRSLPDPVRAGTLARACAKRYRCG